MPPQSGEVTSGSWESQLQACQVGVPSALGRCGEGVTLGPGGSPDHPLSPSKDEKPAVLMPTVSDYSLSN